MPANLPQRSTRHWRRGLFGVLYPLGAWPALAWELAWHRQLLPVAGTSLLATSMLLAAFMAGLAAGALATGRLVERIRRPVLAFSLVQLAGALAAWLPGLAAALWPTAVATATLAVTLAALPLGACFPLAAAIRARDGSGQGPGAGRLYALDCAAGLAGCLATLMLLPRGGVNWVLCLGATSKVAVALATPLLFGPAGAGAGSRFAPASPDRGGRVWPLLLVGLCGLAVLGAESLWSRLLAFVLFKGSTVYAFTTMVAVVLAAGAAGAYLGARLLAARDGDPGRILAWAGIGCAAGLVWSLVVFVTADPTPTAAALGWGDLVVAMVACAPAPLCSALAFAAACRMLPQARAAGWLLGASSGGAVTGALLAPLLLVETAGLAGSLVAMAMLLGLAGWLVPGSSRRARLVATLVLLAAGLAAQAWGPRWAQRLGRLLYYREGRQATVAVVELPNRVRRLYVDAVAVAGDDLAMLADQYLLAHLPLALHPDARRVLTVGLGSGTTSRALLDHPGLRVDCAEISSAVVQALPYFSKINRELHAEGQARFRLVRQDVRTWLARTESSYDVIVNDCTDLAYRSDASLYTEEFFRLMATRLSPRGLAAAWVPLRGQEPFLALRSVVAAFLRVYPHASLWVFDSMPLHFGILVGSNRPLRVAPARFERLLENPAIAAQLQQVGLADASRLMASRHYATASLRRLAGPVPANRDSRPLVEFWAPLETGGDESTYRLLRLVPASEPVPLADWKRERIARLARRLRARPWMLAAAEHLSAGRLTAANLAYVMALRIDPDDPAAGKMTGLGTEQRRRWQREGRRDSLSAPLREAAAWLVLGRPERCLETLQTHPSAGADSRGALLEGWALVGQDDCETARPALSRAFADRRLATRARLALLLCNMPNLLRKPLWHLTSAGL